MMTLLVPDIYRLVSDLPAETVQQIADALVRQSGSSLSTLKAQLLQQVGNTALADRLALFFDRWRNVAPDVSPGAVALALLTASAVEIHHRQRQKIQLVWTGPVTRVIPLRRTEQTLLELINSAESSLHIVSFAVYRAERIRNALLQAALRGVHLSIYLETPDMSEGRMAYDTLRAIGSDLIESATVYVWPLHNRPLSAAGKRGSLHAKVTVADEKRLLISSANLTDYAVTINMEMGVLIDGGNEPRRVASHLTRLTEHNVFRVL